MMYPGSCCGSQWFTGSTQGGDVMEGPQCVEAYFVLVQPGGLLVFFFVLFREVYGVRRCRYIVHWERSNIRCCKISMYIVEWRGAAAKACCKRRQRTDSFSGALLGGGGGVTCIHSLCAPFSRHGRASERADEVGGLADDSLPLVQNSAPAQSCTPEILQSRTTRGETRRGCASRGSRGRTSAAHN
jgi:hypothetical protein